ncbi:MULTISPECIES: hypothetical protein [Apilactobacillus]|uniref:hypothetical protein n=1 Tax=Apilactobacillus TaxID=2767877 RepID=UPI001128A78A|nr:MULTISPECIES: hypothetical protein [Apilactobacillus]TPR18318.1 hypothetical protein DYZ95_03185 [Apilactobacillus timberlakei]TPR45488.1 hypothetical protein DY124_00605 [Apilactobacillus micheneri]TPR48934.1 hypothetical protein DY125_00605 [Apilactobacillus micheneri]
MNYKDKLWVQGLILFIPLFMIIDGMIEMAKDDIYHPDTFVLFGLLIMGVISLISVPLSVVKIISYGWCSISTYDKCYFIFYLLWLIPTTILWLFFLNIIPISLFNF